MDLESAMKVASTSLKSPELNGDRLPRGSGSECSRMTRSLLDMVEERDRRTLESGHYFGVRQLTLKEQDPIRYERFYSRLLSIMVASYEVSRYVTASPGAREMGEILWALLTPEGDALALSPGFFSHMNSGIVTVRFMADHKYDENPGIRDGDVYSTDDGESGGAPHPGDMYTYVPIIVDGELIAWAMGINHIMEAGGSLAGSWPSYCADTFSDGFVFPPTKTGENLVQYTWWEQLWMRRTRSGVMNNLDDKMRLAGCGLVHREIKKLLEEFGKDYYTAVIREVVEETHLAVKDNIQNTSMPGRYDGAGFRVVKYKGLMPLAEHANKDQLIHIRQRMRVSTDGMIHANMDGTSAWDYHAFNGYPGGADVAFYMAMVNSFSYNTKPSSGVLLACKSKYPLGSVYNPGTTVASFSNIWAHSNILNTLGYCAIVRGFFARGFLEEAFVPDADWEGIQGDGTLPDGTPFGMTDFTGVGAAAQGAYSFRDGLPLAWAQWTQLPNIGNAEEFEYLMPGSIYLGRGLIPGFCGHGRFRGGVGQGCVHWVTVGEGRVTMSRAGSGMAYTTFNAQGMSGGYPAPNAAHISARGTNSQELVTQGVALPRTGTELLSMVEQGVLKADKLEIWRFDMPPLGFEDGDLLATHNAASGGWGDPLERSPKNVVEDLDGGWITPEFARGLYGVVSHDEGGELAIDEEQTAREQEAIRAERRARSVPAQEFWRLERDVLLSGELIEPIRYMYSRTVSEEEDFDREMREFWQLPTEFEWSTASRNGEK